MVHMLVFMALHTEIFQPSRALVEAALHFYISFFSVLSYSSVFLVSYSAFYFPIWSLSRPAWSSSSSSSSSSSFAFLLFYHFPISILWARNVKSMLNNSSQTLTMSINSDFTFLVSCLRLFNLFCPLVGPSVHQTFDYFKLFLGILSHFMSF